MPNSTLTPHPMLPYTGVRVTKTLTLALLMLSLVLGQNSFNGQGKLAQQPLAYYCDGEYAGYCVHL
jgi:hypothetical protein